MELHQCLRPHSEIHWVMLTLASRLTNRQSCIKRINLSTQALISVVFSPRGLWWCMSEDGRNVVVYGLYIWVRVNMLCVLLCFKHSSCLIQSTILNDEHTIIHSQNVHSAQLYGGKYTYQDREENTTESVFKGRLSVHLVIKTPTNVSLVLSFLFRISNDTRDEMKAIIIIVWS